MNPVVLLGAGFSRNWGGWLASEAFEYLLGSPQTALYLASERNEVEVIRGFTRFEG
jgi:hypothetical protein